MSDDEAIALEAGREIEQKLMEEPDAARGGHPGSERLHAVGKVILRAIWAARSLRQARDG